MAHTLRTAETREYDRTYYYAHRKERIAAQRRSEAKNPIRTAAAMTHRANRRRAILMGSRVTRDRAEIRAIIDLYVRAKCLGLATGIPHEVDHVVPISRGGEHSLSNLQILTAAENRRKAADE